MKRFFDPYFPFSPKKSPFFYGWVVLVVSMLGTMSSIPGQTVGFSPFTPSLITASGMSRTMLSTTYLVGTLISGFSLSYLSRIVDRIGCRKFIVLNCCLYSMALVWMSYACELATSLSEQSNIPNSFLQFIFLCFGIFWIRFCGQGILPIISSTLIGRWFIKIRGRVNSVSGMVMSMAFSSAPTLMYSMIGFIGWQRTWHVMALWILFGLGILGWLFIRDYPEQCGLSSDGVKSDIDEKEEMEGVTAKEAVRSRSFWAVCLPLNLHSLALTAYIFHIAALANEKHVAESEAMQIFMYVAMVSIPMGFCASWLSDRIGIRPLVMFMSLNQIFAYTACAYFETTIGFFAIVIFLGMASGMFGPLYALSMAKLFGRKHLGEINSRLTSFLVISSAIGPLIFSILQSVSGTYKSGLFLCVGIAILSSLFNLVSQKLIK